MRHWPCALVLCLAACGGAGWPDVLDAPGDAAASTPPDIAAAEDAPDLPVDPGSGDGLAVDSADATEVAVDPTDLPDLPEVLADPGPDLAPLPCDPDACGGPCAEPCPPCTPLVGAEAIALECSQCGGADFCIPWSHGYHVRASCFPHRVDSMRGAFATSDGGSCWVRSEQPTPASVGGYGSPCPGAWLSAPDPAYLYVEFDGQLRRSTDGGRTFVQPAFGQGLQWIWRLTAHPGSGRVYVIDQGAWFIARSDDGGATYTSAKLASLTLPEWTVPDVRDVAVSPGDPDLVLVGGRWHRQIQSTTTYNLARSVDGGVSWSFTRVVPTVDDTVTAVAFAPSLPARVYATTGKQGLLRSDDAGLTWAQVADGKAGIPRVHPRDPDHLWTGIRVSLDGGVTWADQDIGLQRALLMTVTCPSEPQVPCREWALLRPDSYGAADRLLTRPEGGAWTEVMAGLPAIDRQAFMISPVALLQSPAKLDEAVVVFQAEMTWIY